MNVNAAEQKPQLLIMAFDHGEKVMVVGSRKIWNSEVRQETELAEFHNRYSDQILATAASTRIFVEAELGTFHISIADDLSQALQSLVTAWNQEDEEQRQAAARKAIEPVHRALPPAEDERWDNWHDYD